MIDGNVKGFIAGADITQFLRVKSDSTVGQVVVAGAGEDDLGITQKTEVSGREIPVKLRSGSGTFKATVDSATVYLDLLYGAAAGKVSPTENGKPRYRALEAGSADGSIIEVEKIDAEPDTDQSGIAGEDRVEFVEDFAQFPGLSADITQTAAAITDNSGGAASQTVPAATNIDTLTDSTSGAADDTINDVSTAVTGVDGSGSNAASKADVDTRLGVINNNFKDMVDQHITQEAFNTVMLNAVASILDDLNKLTTVQGTRAGRNDNFQVSGTNMTSALATYNSRGGITLTTAGASADQAILETHDDTKQTLLEALEIGTEDEVTFETIIETGASIASGIVWAGLKLTDTPVIATDNDQIFFRYEAGVNSGKFQVVSSRTGVDTSTDSGVTVAASTIYRLRIVVASDLTFKAYINGDLVVTGAALTTGIDLKIFIGVEDSAGAAKNITVFAPLRISRSISA